MFDLGENLLFDKNMHRYFWIFLIFCSSDCFLIGQGRHLLISQIGEGAIVSQEKGLIEPLMRASFLPLDLCISVQPRSGLETLSAGYQFRFGADTKFSLVDETLDLQEGSIMIQSRKMGNRVVIQSPESLLRVSGVGTCMLEVETNGGIKVIGVLGRMILRAGKESKETDLLAGELIFVKPREPGFGDKINVNLTKVLETSFLLSAFKNSTSFQNSLTSIARIQKDSTSKIYAAEVGDAKESDTFEVITTSKVEKPKNIIPVINNETPISLIDRSSYIVPETDPLHELLGRSPTRSGSLPNPVTTFPPVDTRPLPGTLLRLKK
jgi:hypothetical protein